MSVLSTILDIFRFNRRNWKVVVLCILAATIFWLFNALNKTYTTNITFPLEFDYDKETFVAVQPLPSNVRINVKGIGWDLFRRSAGVKVPALSIPLERPSEIKKIVATPGLFAHQLDRFQLNFVLSDTLTVDVEPIEKRWITVRLDVSSISLKANHVRIGEPQLKPDSIFVVGPLPLIRSFIEPVYLKLSESAIDENYNEDVEVEFLHNDLLKRDPPTVNVSFKVDKLVEMTDSIELQVINYPKGANPYLGIRALPCRFSIPEGLVEEYKRDSVVAVIDLRHFVKGTQRVKPDVIGLPPYSIVHHIDSIYVKF